MEKKHSETKEQSRLRAFLTGDRLKAALPLIGFVIILLVMHIATDGRILTPKKLRLLFSQIYYPTIVATGVFFIMTLGSIDFTEGSTLGVASIVVSVLSFYSIPLAILGGILTGAAIGAINGFFHVKFRLPSFIVTICTMYLFRGVCACQQCHQGAGPGLAEDHHYAGGAGSGLLPVQIHPDRQRREGSRLR